MTFSTFYKHFLLTLPRAFHRIEKLKVETQTTQTSHPNWSLPFSQDETRPTEIYSEMIDEAIYTYIKIISLNTCLASNKK